MNKIDSVEKHGTDVAAIRLLKDADIDFFDTHPITEEMFERSFIYKNFEPIAASNQTAVPIFNDVVEFFRKRQIHYTFEIDRVLRDYIAAEIDSMKEADE